MSSEECCVVEKSLKDKVGFLEAHHRMPDGKLVATVQICLRCGRTLPFKPNRKRCPYCQNILRRKAIVLKIP